MLNLSQRVELLIQLGQDLSSIHDETTDAVFYKAEIENPWFTQSNIHSAVDAIRSTMLSEEAIRTVVDKYRLDDNILPKVIGLVLAGNIPLVGWHDIMCIFLAGHKAQIKLAEKDSTLIKWILDKMTSINPQVSEHFDIVEKIKDYDAAIATGSNNTAQHFSHYLRHVPNVIRRNRNSIAILTGDETQDDIEKLGDDIFLYFGLGCRNVSQIYVPRDYDVTRLLGSWEKYAFLANHNKYKNNHEYNVALYLLNLEPFLHNDFVIFKESDQIISRIATVHIARYDSMDDLDAVINLKAEEIQCIVAKDVKIDGFEILPFGESQKPTILTYADGVDTMQFLLGLE
jgi:hypothetical protein